MAEGAPGSARWPSTSRRRLVDLGDAGIWPDGMTVDDAGMLWVAMGRAGAVHRYRADGTLDGVVEVPTTNPTSVAFGGADGGDLYITTSWVDCEPGARTGPLAGAVFRCRPGVTGRPSPRCTAASAALDSSSLVKGDPS
jgi:sugar lactone lactonase YvrE